MPGRRFAFQNNIAPHNAYGIIGTDRGVGRETIDAYFPGAVVRGNAIVGGDAARYPRDNFFPVSPDDLGFSNRAAGDYRLTARGRFKMAGTDKKDPGTDFGALSEAMGPVFP
jgi:hypothetical protein